MADIKFTNFARTQLAVGINAGDLTMSVVGGTGALFPSLSAGQYFYVTLENASLVREIVKVTARTTDTFTIVRAQDNTTALAWTTSDTVSLRFNAAAIADVFAAMTGDVVKADLQTQLYTAFTSAGTAPAYTLTPVPAIASLAAPQRFRVNFHTATSGACTLAVSGQTATALKQYDSTGAKVDPTLAAGQKTDVEFDGTDWVVLDPLPAAASTVPRSYIAGLTLSTAGSSATMSIAAGQAADSTNVALINLASAISKTTSAWAVGSGNGGLDTGSPANNTSYHFHLIRRPDTGVADVLFSLSATSPTLPANYTQFRRIGSARTNGSAQWVRFFQDGDLFQLETPVLDITTTGEAATAITRTLGSIPTGIRVGAIFNYNVSDPGNANNIPAYFSDLNTADLDPSQTAAPLASSLSLSNSSIGGMTKIEVMTNTSAQIRSRRGSVGVSGTWVMKIATLGWRDSRGKDL